MSLPNNFPSVSKGNKVSVLYVCLGNICRSPTADGILRHMVKEAGEPYSSLIYVDSCGTANYHCGEDPDERTQKYAKIRGYDLSELRARQFTKKDFDEFDIILCADDNNVSGVKRLATTDEHRKKVMKITDFIPKTSKYFGVQFVPDPYYGQATDFYQVIDLCEESCRHLLEKIKQH